MSAKAKTNIQSYKQPLNTFGQIAKDESGKYIWQVSNLNGIIEEVEISRVGYLKEFTTDILQVRETPSTKTFEGIDRSWYHCSYTYRIRDEATNLFLKYSQGTLFIIDAEPLGFRTSVGYDSNDNYKVTKTKPVKVSSKQAAEIQKRTQSKYLFNRVINGEFVTTV